MSPVIVDLGCGAKEKDGTPGLDRRLQRGVDLVCDVERPLPLKTSSIDAVYMSHIVEHVRDLILCMEEVYRVCSPGAEVRVTAPYYTSRGAFRDPTHVRFITEDTFQYFEPPTDYGIRTNFRIETIKYDVRKPFRYFLRYLQKRFRRYLWNVVDNMYVTLRVNK
jgi:ubiquinone/menaquinone biosynthesis C-methylase UbiE